jgi:hypothetical protein
MRLSYTIKSRLDSLLIFYYLEANKKLNQKGRNLSDSENINIFLGGPPMKKGLTTVTKTTYTDYSGVRHTVNK